MTEPLKPCVICDHPDFPVAWTDRHGVAVCVHCNAPYRILHYENDKRVEKPAECLIKEASVPLLRRYYEETGKRVVPGAFNFPGSSYEQCCPDDFRSYAEWMKANEEDTNAR